MFFLFYWDSPAFCNLRLVFGTAQYFDYWGPQKCCSVPPKKKILQKSCSVLKKPISNCKNVVLYRKSSVHLGGVPYMYNCVYIYGVSHGANLVLVYGGGFFKFARRDISPLRRSC